MRRATFLKAAALALAAPRAFLSRSGASAAPRATRLRSGQIFAADSFSAETKPVYEITGGKRADFATLNAHGWIGPLAVSPDGRLWAATSAMDGSLWDITAGGDLTAATPFASGLFPGALGFIEGLAFDGSGNAYLANSEAGMTRIAVVAPDGSMSNLSPMFADPCGLAVSGNTLYIGEGDKGQVVALDLISGAMATQATGFTPAGSHVSAQLVIDPRGRLLGQFIADGGTGVFDLTAGGDFSQKKPLIAATFRIDVNQIAVDAQNNIYSAGDGDGAIYISRFANGAFAPFVSFVDQIGDTESVVVVP